MLIKNLFTNQKEVSMHRYISLTFLFTLFILMAGCSQKVQNPEMMVAAADELDEQFIEAYNNRDLDGLMATYWNSPDLAVFPAGMMAAKGWDNVKASFEKEFSDSTDFKLELLTHNNRAEGDVVIGTGTWRYTLNIPGIEPMVFEGRFTDVKAEREGKWLYVIDHASVPLPPPPGEE